jgi:hypothetical protein
VADMLQPAAQQQYMQQQRSPLQHSPQQQAARAGVPQLQLRPLSPSPQVVSQYVESLQTLMRLCKQCDRCVKWPEECGNAFEVRALAMLSSCRPACAPFAWHMYVQWGTCTVFQHVSGVLQALHVCCCARLLTYFLTVLVVCSAGATTALVWVLCRVRSWRAGCRATAGRCCQQWMQQPCWTCCCGTHTVSSCTWQK